MATFGYVRMGSAWEAGRGRREVQQRPIAGYAVARGLQVDQTFVETGVSGWVPLADRPQGKPLLDRLKGGDVVIITKLDRMFGGALDALDLLAELKARGISLHVIELGGDVTGDRIGQVVFTILSWVVAAAGERVAAVRREQRARGRYLGGIPPFGWRVGDGGELVAVPEQQEALTRMHRLSANGATLRAIAAQMRADGFQISHTGVKKVLDAAPRAEGCAGRSDAAASAKVASKARRCGPRRQAASDLSLRTRVANALRENPEQPNASQVARAFGLAPEIVSEIARAAKIALPLHGGRPPMSSSERARIVAALREMRNVGRAARATGWSPATARAIAKAENIALAPGSAKRRERAD
jgi:putative DNA-invertase from lambdoid prophage Rac